MDSAEFLDLLGNANRRRILSLLAERPCYVTEISEFLGVSPKAVIDHLKKLEDAGLVESRTDSKRRKYFSIARHLRLEVTVSPYEFGTKSAYPASSRLDISSCRYLTIELDDDPDAPALLSRTETDAESPPTDEPETEDESPPTDEPETEEDSANESLETDSPQEIIAVTEALSDVEQLEKELSLAQRWAQGRILELREQLETTLGTDNSRLLSDVLLELAEQPREVESLSRSLEVPPRIIEELLEELVAAGAVSREGRHYHLDG